MTFLEIPLLSGKALSEFTPDEFHSYVRSLYREPVRKVSSEPPKEITVRLNAKGTPVLRIRRDPKFLTYGEARVLAGQLSLGFQDFLRSVRKKKVEVRRG